MLLLCGGSIGLCGLFSISAGEDGGSRITATYGWEDGRGLVIGKSGNLTNPTNITSREGPVASGKRALRITEQPHSGTPEAWIAFIEHLTDGDEITASYLGYDDPSTSDDGRLRIWAHYATSGDPTSYLGSAGGNPDYTSGIGWEEISHTWTFDGGGEPARNALIIQARLYSTPASCDTCSTDYFIDQVHVSVRSPRAENIAITFPDEIDFDRPGEPSTPVCIDPAITSTYGWEDGKGTISGGTPLSVISAENTSQPVFSGSRALRITESPHHPTQNPAIYLAQIENLSDGDVVEASFRTLDQTPGSGPGGYPAVRIWAHYTSGPGPTPAGSLPTGEQNHAYSSGEGWDELQHAWTFDSDGGRYDGIVIQARLYSPDPGCDACSTDFFIDELNLAICAKSPANIVITYPDFYYTEPTPPIEMCDEPLTGTYSWEDGRATYITASSSSTISGENITAPTQSGGHALRITESPHHPSNPDVHIAFIEHLSQGDLIRARMWTYDDSPGNALSGYPSVRLWGRYAYSGDPLLTSGSAGGNESWSSGIGWEELEHTWEFHDGSGFPHDALLIAARVYAPSCPDGETCSTDYFIDDIAIEVCSSRPDLTITFPDGSFIGNRGRVKQCLADVDRSGGIDIFDHLAILTAWNTAHPMRDVNADGIVNGADDGIVLASLGPCDDFLYPMHGSAELIIEQTRAAGGMRQCRLLIELAATDRLINVYDASITSSSGFASGSFITIGADGLHFDIETDPNFDSAWPRSTSLGENAGWYNLNPPNGLGDAAGYPQNRVLIAQLLIDEAAELQTQVSITYADADGRARQATRLTPSRPGPPCAGDLTGDTIIDVFDLLNLLAGWGPCRGGPCAADINGSGAVDVFDLLELLTAWGPCP